MKQIYKIIFLLFIATTGLLAQNNDCIDALPICTTSSQNFPSGNSGSGTADPGLNTGCATESQSSWYYFTITTGGVLSFIIDPANNSTDYDWALYLSPYGSPATPATDCNGSNELGAPVRCNFSATTGNTGLSTTATNASEPASGSSFSTTLTVTAGQVYYIMINNYSGDGYPFAFSANTGNTAALSCTGVTPPTSPCTCAGPTCNNAFHATEAAATSENATITTGADCTVFSPIIPVETDGSTDMTFCADYTIPVGTTLAAFTTAGQFKLVSGGTCTGTILNRSVYASGSCGTALTSTGNVTSGGYPIYAVTPGSTYVFCQTIRLAGPDCLQYNSSCINVFTVPAPPANDQCAGATALTCGLSSTGTTINATTTNDPTVTCNGETVDAPGVWYTFTSATNQSVTLDTDNGTTNFDTKIHVYTAASCAGPFTCVTADDDAGTGLTSLASFAATAGTTYYVLVSGASGATGNFALDVACVSAPVNDVCSGALTLTCGSTLTAQNNTSATSTEDGLVCGTTVGATSRGMWYKFVGDGRIATLTTTSLTGSEITVWTGSDCSSLTCLSGVLGATHTFTAEAGITYYVLASTNAGGASAAFSIGLTCATPAYNVGGGTTGGGTAFCNNNIYTGSASALPTNTLVVTALAGTLRDPGGTGNYANSTDATNTSTVICPNGADGGAMTFTFTSFNTESGIDLVYVYDGPTYNYAQVPGSPFSGTSLPSSITSTNATGCLAFQFFSDASVVNAGFEGTWTSTGDTGVDLVVNDDCSNALPVGIECPTVSGTNINATASCSDPTPAFFSASTLENTVWYKFTVLAADAGATTITISNINCPDFANISTPLASRGLQYGVYDGGTTGGVCPLASQNTTGRIVGGTATNPGPVTSTSFTTLANHTYYIGIDGNAGSSCDFDITIDRYATNFAVNSATSGSYSYTCDAAPAQTADVALTLSGGRTTGYSVTVVPSSISVTNSGAVYTLNNIPDGTTWTATATDGLCTQIISGVYSYDATCNPCPSYSKSNITLTPTTSTVCAGQTVTFNTLAVDAARSVPTVRAATLGGRKYGDGVGGTAPLNYVADYKKYIQLLPFSTMNATTIGTGVSDAQINGLDFTINAKWNDMYIVLKNTSCAGSVVIWNGVNNTAFAGGTDATVSTGSTTLTYSAATGLFTPNTSISSYSSVATLAAMNTAFAGCNPQGFYLEFNDQSSSVLQYSINNFLFSVTDKTTTAVTPTTTLTNIAWVGSGSATGGVSGTHTNIAELTLSNSDKNATFTAPTCAGPGNCVYTYTVTGKDVNGCTVTGTATITVTPPANNVNDITLCAGAAASSFSSTATCTGTVTGTATGTNATTNTLVNGTPKTINLSVSGVPAGATITDVNVSVTIAHNYSSDVVLSIASPAATSVALTDGAAGGSNNLGNTSATITTASTGSVATYVFDEDVATAVWPATDPIPAGSYNPTGNLNTYDATSSINGTWVLSASDDASGDDGVITGVTVTIAYSYPVAVEWYTVATGGTAVQTGTTFNPINDAEVLAAGAPYSSLTNTNTPGVYTFYTGCTGSVCREPVTYTINAKPVITAGLTQAICSGTAASRSITLSTDLPGTETFAWSTPTMTAGISGGTAGTGTTITDVLSNSGTTAGTATYTVTVTADAADGGCTNTANVVITVNPNPTITLSSTTTATCSGNTSATLAYTATTGSPNQYSVDYDATAEGQGFVDVTNSALPATPITLTVPAGAAPGTYNAAITVRNSTTTCSSTTYNVTVTVNARPVITAGLTETVCSGVATNRTITLSTDLPGTETYAWNTPVVTGSMTGGAAGTGSTIINTLTNTTATAQTATYVVTVTAAAADGGCTSTANVVITVNPRPVITAGLTQAICSGTAASRTITLSTDLAGTETFAWGIPTMTAGVTGGVAGSGSSITDVLSNSGTTAGTATYVVTVTADVADGGCTNTANVVITVNPVPVITSGLTAEACSGVAVSRSITLSTDPSGAETYSWAAPVNTGGMTGGTSGTVPPITGTFTNNTASAQTATYTVIVTGTAGSCTSSRDVVITVNPLPTVNAGSDVAICNGGSAALSAAGSGGTGALSYSWTPAGTLTGASTATPTATPTSTTTYIVTVSDTKLCSATDNVQVTVNAAPTATAAATNVTCAGSVANADGKITISGFTLGTDKYDYTTGATYSGSATYTTATLIPAGGIIVSNLTNPAVSQQYTVRIFSSSDSGCYIDRTVTLTNVNCTCPTITISPATAAACAGSANISFTQTGGAASGTWTIDSPMSGGGSIVAATGVYSPPATVASPTTVVIKYSEPSPSNCFGTHTITINPVPAAPTATVTAQPTCATATGTITVTAPAAGAGITYTVTGTSPVVAAVSNATGIFAGLTTGTYNVTTSANGCTSSPISLTVNAQPTPPAAATASTTIQPTCAVATGTIVVTAPLGATLEYNIDGGAYQSSTTFAGVAAGSHTILVRSTTDNTCVSSSTSVTVNAQPTPPAAATASTTIQPTCAVATGTIVVTAPLGATLEYNIDGGAYQSSTTFAGVAAGSHTILVRSTTDNTCVSSSTSVTVNAQPTPPAAATASTTIQPTCTVATGTIVVTAPLGATLEYNIDGGAYQSSTTFAGVAAGSHTILVRSTTDNTCVSASTSVTVDPQPATPSISSTPTTCTGSTYSITVNATVSSGTLEYSLDGGAYQTSNTFTALANGSTHSVTVRTVGTTCTATTSGITATCACAAPPAVAITQTTLSTCGTNLVTLNYTVTNGPATMTSSGTGTFSSTTLSDGTGSITYTPSAGDAGTTVTLTATIADPDGAGICAASSDFVTLTVNARPATVAGASSSVNCGGTINLTSTPTGAVSYSWVGPNGYTANVQNPVRTTATASMTGTYTVTVTGTNGCTASATTSVTVGGCTFVFRISDPCSCRNNATNLTNGQFNEVVTVYGPAGFVVRAETITGLYQTSSTALVTVPFSTPVPMTHNGLSGTQSGYILQGVHVDDIGYTVTVGIYESDGVTPVDLDPATAGVQNNMTVANKCAYPNPDFALASSTVCNHPANAITLTATNSYGPNGTGVFSGIGVSGTTFNPTVAGTGGPYAILLTYTGGITVATTDLDGDGDIDASDNGVSIDNGITPAFPGCIQPLTKSITVIDCCNSDSGTW